MKNEYITLTGISDAALSVPQEVSNQKEELQISAYAVKTVANAQQAEQAGMIFKEVSQFIKMIEASRKIVKDPINQLGKKVDAFAAELTTDLESEKDRIGKMLAIFQAEENAKAERAARAAQIEEQRIIREAQEKERQAAIAAVTELDKARRAAEAFEAKAREDARIEAEKLAAKAASARSASARAKAEADAKLASERAAIEAKARQDAYAKAEAERTAKAEEDARLRFEAEQQKIADTRLAAATAAAPKQTGISTRKVPKFEITDIAALYAARPELVKLEANTSLINGLVKANPNISIPGLRCWMENASAG